MMEVRILYYWIRITNSISGKLGNSSFKKDVFEKLLNFQPNLKLTYV